MRSQIENNNNVSNPLNSNSQIGVTETKSEDADDKKKNITEKECIQPTLQTDKENALPKSKAQRRAELYMIKKAKKSDKAIWMDGNHLKTFKEDKWVTKSKEKEQQ